MISQYESLLAINNLIEIHIVAKYAVPIEGIYDDLLFVSIGLQVPVYSDVGGMCKRHRENGCRLIQGHSREMTSCSLSTSFDKFVVIFLALTFELRQYVT